MKRKTCLYDKAFAKYCPTFFRFSMTKHGLATSRVLPLSLAKRRRRSRHKILRLFHGYIRLYRRYPVRSVVVLVFVWSLATTLIQLLIMQWKKPNVPSWYPGSSVETARKKSGIPDPPDSRGRLTLVYTYGGFGVHPIEQDIKHHPQVTWIEHRLSEDSKYSMQDTLHHIRNCTQTGLDLIARSLSLSSWLTWKGSCALSRFSSGNSAGTGKIDSNQASAEDKCFSYLKNLCLGSYIVIKAAAQGVTLQDLLNSVLEQRRTGRDPEPPPALRLLHLVPAENSLPRSLLSYWGKIQQAISPTSSPAPSPALTAVNRKADLCSHLDSDINFLERNQSTWESLDSSSTIEYMILNAEQYKSDPQWYVRELLNFLDLYPSDYHLQLMHNTPQKAWNILFTEKQSTGFGIPRPRTPQQVNLDGLQALRALQHVSRC